MEHNTSFWKPECYLRAPCGFLRGHRMAKVSVLSTPTKREAQSWLEGWNPPASERRRGCLPRPPDGQRECFICSNRHV